MESVFGNVHQAGIWVGGSGAPCVTWGCQPQRHFPCPMSRQRSFLTFTWGIRRPGNRSLRWAGGGEACAGDTFSAEGTLEVDCLLGNWRLRGVFANAICGLHKVLAIFLDFIKVSAQGKLF